jgi:hypothetical protein
MSPCPLLAAVDLPWTAAITEQALRYFHRVIRYDTQQGWHARSALSTWAKRCDVPTAMTILSELLAGCDENSPWRKAIEQCNDAVAFRAAMRQELLT